MPKVTVSKARKDYPEEGIAKGDTYYSWAFFRGPIQRSKTPPRLSQLTGSANLSAAYLVVETLQDDVAAASTPEGVKEALDNAASEADDAISAYDETISNLEQAFTGGCPALETAQEQRDALEEFKNACETAAQEVDDLDYDHYEAAAVRAEGVVGWDSLSDAGKEDMMTAARELADEPSFDY